MQVDDAQQTAQNTDKDASLSMLDSTIEKGCPRSKLVHTTYKPFPRYEKSWSRFSLWPSTRKLAQAWSVLYDEPQARPWNWFYSQPNCALYNKNIDLNYITCLNVFEAIQPEKDDLVTLLTQLTFGRFERVQQMASKWRGPMSVAFYVTSSELHANVSQIEQWIAETGRRNIAVHFMVQRGVSKIMAEYTLLVCKICVASGIFDTVVSQKRSQQHRHKLAKGSCKGPYPAQKAGEGLKYNFSTYPVELFLENWKILDIYE